MEQQGRLLMAIEQGFARETESLGLQSKAMVNSAAANSKAPRTGMLKLVLL